MAAKRIDFTASLVSSTAHKSYRAPQRLAGGSILADELALTFCIQRLGLCSIESVKQLTYAHV